MANIEHFTILKQGVSTWNAWRAEHPDVQVDLNQAPLRGMRLVGVNLEGALLIDADLQGTDLSHANLARANLSGVNLSDAQCRAICLDQALLVRAKPQENQFR